MKSLQKMSARELRKVIAKAEQELAVRRRQERERLRREILSIAAQAGFDFREVLKGRNKS